jgi:hypothetical protein
MTNKIVPTKSDCVLTIVLICSDTFFKMTYKLVLAIVIFFSVHNNNMCLTLLFRFVLTLYLLFEMTYKLVLTVILVCSRTSFVLFQR